MSNSIDDLLAGGGKTAKFPTVGTSYSGTVVSAEPRQSTNFDTGKPEFWDDGKPKMQIVIALETAERADAEDDGVRSVYVKAYGDQRKALQQASKNAGGSPAKGDFFKVTYVGDGEKPARGYAPKIYTFEIRKANPVDAALSGGGEAPVQQFQAQAAAVQAAAPVYNAAPVAPAGGGALSPALEAQVKLFIEKSLTDDQIASVIDGVTAADAAGVRLQLAAGSGGGF